MINKIRSDIDSQEQRERQNKQGGLVRLFAISSSKDKQAAEIEVMQRMAVITGDSEWNTREAVVSLILEHRMAAYRMGFGEMFDALYPVDSFKLGLMDGTLPEIKIFSEAILPILDAHAKGDKFAIANIVKTRSRLFKKQYIKEHSAEAKTILAKANANIEKLCKAYDNNADITFGELLKIAYAGGIFGVPKGYEPILMRTPVEQEVAVAFEEDDAKEPSDDKIDCLDSFLNTKFSQIRQYATYVSEEASFFTHQGVKGLEFPRVMAIIDDSEMKGFLFSYEKLFGVKSKTANDLKNEHEGKETGIDRTRRLFYVICSRAEESLAVAAYTSNPVELKRSLSRMGWFSDDEIIILN